MMVNGIGIGVEAESFDEAMKKLMKKLVDDIPDYKVTINGREVKVERKDGKVGIAKCHPDDVFDVSVGFKEALNKIEKPHKKLNFEDFTKAGVEDLGIIIRNQSQLDTIAKACEAYGFRMANGTSVSTLERFIDSSNGFVLYSSHRWGSTYRVMGDDDDVYEFEDVIIKKSAKFKIGDVVVGNEKANEKYSFTREGYVGLVTDCGNGIITITELNRSENPDIFTVEENYFDLYEPKIGDCVKLIPMDKLSKEAQHKYKIAYRNNFGVGVVSQNITDEIVNVIAGNKKICVRNEILYPVKIEEV